MDQEAPYSGGAFGEQVAREVERPEGRGAAFVLTRHVFEAEHGKNAGWKRCGDAGRGIEDRLIVQIPDIQAVYFPAAFSGQFLQPVQHNFPVPGCSRLDHNQPEAVSGRPFEEPGEAQNGGGVEPRRKTDCVFLRPGRDVRRRDAGVGLWSVIFHHVAPEDKRARNSGISETRGWISYQPSPLYWKAMRK